MTNRVAPTVLALGLLGGCGQVAGEASGADGQDPSDSATPSPVSPTPSATVTPSEVAPLPTETGARRVTVYYVGDGPSGPVLFREVRRVEEPDHGPAEAIGLLTAEPRDPDYRTAWPRGVFSGGRVNLDDGTIDVFLADTSQRDRPESMGAAEAQASIQQVVSTLQAYAGDDLPVRFLLGEKPADRVLGVPTAEPVAASPVVETLSLMSLTTPEEGQVVSGSFRASGFNNGFEGTAAWQVMDQQGNVLTEGATIGGWMGDQLYPWHDRVDVSRLAPGTYSFLASNDDPTGGTEGFGPDVDTRTIVVQ